MAEQPLDDAIQDFYRKRQAATGESVEAEIVDAPEIEGKPHATYPPSAKRLFPLKNKYLATIKSMNAKGNKSRAKLLQEQHEIRLQNADAKKWKIKGKEVNRYTMMKWITERLAAGDLLTDIANGSDGLPSLQTVYAWRQEHPEFDKALKLAQKVQAHFFADEGLRKVRNADVSEAKLVKIQHDALLKRAALQNEDFREKQVVQQESRPMGDAKAMQEELINLIKSDPELAKQLQRELGGATLEALALPPSEGQEEPSALPKSDDNFIYEDD